MDKKLGQKLKLFRQAAFDDMGLRRVAEKVDMDYSYLYRIEEGEHTPSDEILFKLADAYKLSLTEKLELIALAHSNELQDTIRQAIETNPNALKTVFYRKPKKK